MKIGIGLPNTIPGVAGSLYVPWATRAEQRGFSSLASLDRIAYPGDEALTVFAACAAVTSRIRLVTNILLAPLRDAAFLAKQAATVDRISNGRLTLGLAPGRRADDFAVTRRSFEKRGAFFDDQLQLLQRAWRDETLPGGDKPVAAPVTNHARVPILIGGMSNATLRRLTSYGIGWTVGGAPLDATAGFLPKLREAWRNAGRDGAPYLVARAYFGLGDTERESMASLADYYDETGRGDQIAAAAPRTPEKIRETIRQFEDLGFDEVLLDPTVASLDQVDLLADAVL